jgi:hypothetical protein
MQKRYFWGLPFLAVAISSPSIASDLNVNGFLSVGATIMDENNGTSIAGADNNGGFKQDTVLGLQIQKQVNDSTSATGQLVSRGSNEYSTEAAWAFVTYAANDNIDLRMGRLRIPFFYYSDFLEVGYAYNWVRPPGEVYRIPFSSIDGTDFTYNFSSGNMDGSVQLYYGRYQGPFVTDFGQGLGAETYAADFKNFTGITLNNNFGDFGTRVSYHQAELSLDTSGTNSTLGLLLNGNGTLTAPGIVAIATVAGDASAAEDFFFTGQLSQFYEVAAFYDNGDISLVAEWTMLEHENAIFQDDQAWMFSAAKRFDDLTLHATYSSQKDDLESGTVGAIQAQLPLESEQTSTTVGVRYDYDSSTALKFEVQNNDEVKIAGADGKSANLFSVAVDIVF